MFFVSSHLVYCCTVPAEVDFVQKLARFHAECTWVSIKSYEVLIQKLFVIFIQKESLAMVFEVEI
jgi:hypothetical protein